MRYPKSRNKVLIFAHQIFLHEQIDLDSRTGNRDAIAK